MTTEKAKSFVIIMIIVAWSALILRFIVIQIVRFNIEQNESSAQSTLKLISTALENYSKDHQGVFPENLGVLTRFPSRYLDKDYSSFSSYRGYVYSCSKIESSGYNCSAIPLICGLSGNTNFSVSTGNLFVSQKCAKKD